ncbi:GNAT family N-acetyltransferase [Psychromicrobium xiongbiense]|uniref:GNAT family N-acetyltransferase n=1 Tax=Psychromicrobium xiongbiense TaxID=3051184 RepID=UPI002553C79F|nr:GNAT family N-acetyltransferase [Psychromicrobium sp. YIM S02556]
MPTTPSDAPSSHDSDLRLVLRNPCPEDEAEVAAAQAELAEDGFDFALRRSDESWEDYLARVKRDRQGIDLSPERVPATMLFAVVEGQIVGRVHIRHELNRALLAVGGHIGYGVRPQYRRRRYATEMLRQGLGVALGLGIQRALVTCDDDNLGSIGTIERCGGVLENVSADATPKRRYWIDLS